MAMLPDCTGIMHAGWLAKTVSNQITSLWQQSACAAERICSSSGPCCWRERTAQCAEGARRGAAAGSGGGPL